MFRTIAVLLDSLFSQTEVTTTVVKPDINPEPGKPSTSGFRLYTNDYSKPYKGG